MVSFFPFSRFSAVISARSCSEYSNENSAQVPCLHWCYTGSQGSSLRYAANRARDQKGKYIDLKNFLGACLRRGLLTCARSVTQRVELLAISKAVISETWRCTNILDSKRSVELRWVPQPRSLFLWTSWFGQRRRMAEERLSAVAGSAGHNRGNTPLESLFKSSFCFRNDRAILYRIDGTRGWGFAFYYWGYDECIYGCRCSYWRCSHRVYFILILLVFLFIFFAASFAVFFWVSFV